MSDAKIIESRMIRAGARAMRAHKYCADERRETSTEQLARVCIDAAIATGLLVRVGDAEGEWVLVPKSALDWLNGEGDSFEPPEGSRGAFWWRTEFKRRCEMIAAINPETK